MDEKYGLDFGTSNSSIAILQHSYVRALPVDPTALNPAVAASVLFMDDKGGSFIGAQAIRLFVEKNTGRQIVRRRHPHSMPGSLTSIAKILRPSSLSAVSSRFIGWPAIFQSFGSFSLMSASAGGVASPVAPCSVSGLNSVWLR